MDHLNLSVSVWFLMQFVYAATPEDKLGLIIPFQVTLNEYENLEACESNLRDIALQPNFMGYNWKVTSIGENRLVARDNGSKVDTTILSQLSCVEIKKNKMM